MTAEQQWYLTDGAECCFPGPPLPVSPTSNANMRATSRLIYCAVIWMGDVLPQQRMFPGNGAVASANDVVDGSPPDLR